MRVRDFMLGDEAELHAVFFSAVHTLAAADYSPAQLEVWAPLRPDLERWGQRMRTLRPFVVEAEGKLLGYADLQMDGYIDHFYVSGTSARQGVGRLLMERIHERARELNLAWLFAHVSRTAQPFFKHFGFAVTEHRTVVRDGVALTNARMTKDLITGGSPSR